MWGGIPSGPYHGPGGRWLEHPLERPGKRVEVIPNDEAVFHDLVGRRGTLVRRNGGTSGRPTYLVYFDDYIDLNAPLSVLRFLPTFEDVDFEDHLFTMRNEIT